MGSYAVEVPEASGILQDLEIGWKGGGEIGSEIGVGTPWVANTILGPCLPLLSAFASSTSAPILNITHNLRYIVFVVTTAYALRTALQSPTLRVPLPNYNQHPRERQYQKQQQQRTLHLHFH